MTLTQSQQRAQKTGIKPTTISARLRNGWSIKDALTVPTGQIKKYHQQ